MTQPRQEKDQEIENAIKNFLTNKIRFTQPEKEPQKDGKKTPDFLLPEHKILIECKHHNTQSTEQKHLNLVDNIRKKIEEKTQDIRKQCAIRRFEIKYNENFDKIKSITEDTTKFDEIINEIIKQIEQKTKLIAEKYKREKINIIIPIENENIHLNIFFSIQKVNQKTTSISITTRCKGFWASIKDSNLSKELDDKYKKYKNYHTDYKQILAFSCDDYSYHAYGLRNNEIENKTEDTDFTQFQQTLFQEKDKLLAIIVFFNNHEENNETFKIGCILSPDKIITSKKPQVANENTKINNTKQQDILQLFADNFNVAFSKNEN